MYHNLVFFINFFRQILRDSSHELKELETKLRAAYAKRELRAQMAENEEKRRLEKVTLWNISSLFFTTEQIFFLSSYVQ